jgi:GNAT superfamily N-acetyltransferase
MITFDTIEEDEYGDIVHIDLYSGIERIGRCTLEFKIDMLCEFENIDEDEYYRLFPNDRAATISTLEVEFTHRGKGYANDLMSKAIEYIGTREYLEVYLNACPIGLGGLPLSNLVRFYEGFGFRTFVKDADNEEMVLTLV